MIALDAVALVYLMECPVVTLATQYLEPVRKTMRVAEVTTDLRAAHFFAQVGHECGGLLYPKELGGATAGAQYEGRRDLGNILPGDGRKFPGRGLIQTTGRGNYYKYGVWRGVGDKFLQHPELLEEPEEAAMSAAWYWLTNGLVAIPDEDKNETTFVTITSKFGTKKSVTVNRVQHRLRRRINGGTNGLEDCQRRLDRNKLFLKLPL